MSQLKNVRVLTACAFLLALATILGFYKIPINQLIEIRFSNLPLAFGGMLFGPVLGGLIGGLSDILAYLVKPTGPYFPGFTISSLIGGVIFGFTLKTKSGKVSIWRIILAEAVYTVVVSMFMNSLNLYILYGNMATQGLKGFFSFMFTRMPKSLIMFPVNTAILYAVIRIIPRTVYEFILPVEANKGDI